jgi:hypothetical protein
MKKNGALGGPVWAASGPATKQVPDHARIRREFDEQGKAAKRLLEAVERIWAEDGPPSPPPEKEDAAK